MGNEVEKIDKAVAGNMAVGVTGTITFRNATEIMEFAKMMAVSGSAVPKHLRGNPGACLGIIDDAMRFEMSPYALARKSYFVNDNLAYEAQVLAAIVNARAALKQRPDIQFTGEGPDRRAIIRGEFRDGAVRDYQSPRLGDITPKNSPLWKADPDQQLAYYGLRAFARRHCPDVLMGVYDYDEIAGMRDVTPPPVKVDLVAKLNGTEAPGFSRDFVEEEILQMSSDQPPDDDGADAPNEAPSAEAGDDGVSPPAQQSSPADDDDERRSTPVMVRLERALAEAMDHDSVIAVAEKFGPELNAMKGDVGDACRAKSRQMVKDRRAEVQKVGIS